ncbi:MAG TPA: phosphoenolpyruvate synthase [Anaerolineae bacterium]|nr:phosphoenolpyruvate synthase [Anaerolineae bacterium]
MSTFILPFTQINHQNLPQVGGKGANLGELTQAGFNVPPGFCVTTAAFHHFISPATATIYPQLDTINPHDLDSLREVGRAVRAHLATLSLPQPVITAITNAWQNLNPSAPYAVRSSATAEDLPHASFAGQQDTYLNIRGQQPLLDSIKNCFISLFTDRAILYRLQNKFDHRQVALSVVVQQMIQSHISGIMFTADPVSGQRHTIAIDASFGLGEALVSGTVSADLYQIDKRSQQITKQQIATKQIAIRSLPDGGTETINLPPDQQQTPALNPDQILALGRLGTQIEAHYQSPQDIEWAIDPDGHIFITQSRPITSLFPLPQPAPTDDALHTYFSFSHFQMMTDPMPPLSLSLWRTILPVGHTHGQLESPYLTTAAGRLYGDLSPLFRHPLLRRILLRNLKFADALAVSAIQQIITRPQFNNHGQTTTLRPILPFLLKQLGRILHATFRGNHRNAAADATTIINHHVHQLQQQLAQTPTLDQQLTLCLDTLRTIFHPILNWAPKAGAGMLSTALLHKIFSADHYTDHLNALSRGVDGNVTTAMNLAVGDLADAAQATPELTTHLQQTDIPTSARLAQAAHIPGGPQFLTAWRTFLDHYGARGPSEIDLHRPRWAEDPSSLLQMVVNAMQHTTIGAHRDHYQKLAEEHETAVNALHQAAHKGFFGFIRAPFVRRLIHNSHHLAPLREHHKFYIVQMLALIKPVFLALGQQLVTHHRLQQSDDIWFLTLPEILATRQNPHQDLQTIVAQRRLDFDRYHHLTPPRVITNEGEIPTPKLDNKNAPEGALIGSPVSAGTIEGLAKVIHDPSTQALNPGEILIAPFTDPGWTPLFVNAAGLITEVGGLMTHGSVVAREYGIPAVVGVPDATKRLKTGQRLRLHGDAGYIEILSQPPTSEAS